jgi:hypothetical protein
VQLRDALNTGRLPPSYYAQSEQRGGPFTLDILTLQTEPAVYARKQRTLVIRHGSNDRVVALLEILSPGNKSTHQAFHALLNKATSALVQNINLLLIDLFPPGPRDPQGIHGAIWAEFSDEYYTVPADKRLTLVAYAPGESLEAYVEPVAVGDPLPDMPLFIAPKVYISVPLETTYQAAFRGVPWRWREVLESSAS